MADAASSFVVSLIENRAKEVGLAAFDLRTAKLHLSQFIETSRSYQNTTTLLQYFDPTDIVTPANMITPQGIIGLTSVVNQCTSASKVILSRSCFDDTKGAILVQNLVLNEALNSTLEASYKQYYLCLGAAAALFRWIDREKGITLANRSVEVTLNGSFDHMNIDGTSVQNLELVESLHIQVGPQKKRGCLFEMLKTTKTAGGTRLLRANLLQPLKDKNTINTRLDCLDELTSDDKIFFGISRALEMFPKDIDRILCSFCFKAKVSNDSTTKSTTRAGQFMVSNIILLKEALDHLPTLQEALQGAKCSLLRNIKDICANPSFRLLLQRIEEVINEDIVHSRALFLSRTQQCFAVKSGIDGYLDVAREVFSSTSEAIHELARRYREEFNLPNLKMPFNNNRGFYISFPEKDLKQTSIPSIFNQVIKKEKIICCSTSELTSLNDRNMEAAAECYKRTSLCLGELITRIREDLRLLTSLSESLALLDMMVNSFANLISTNPEESYIRPEFTETGPVAIEKGRHPVLESTIPGEFVFMTEMRETAYLLNNLTSRSLVVVDELGRATSTGDGFAIAWSCCEYMLSFKAYVLFATHMQRLTELSSVYPNVRVCYFDASILNNRLDFKFLLREGCTNVAHYGIRLAEFAGIPTSVINDAKCIAAKIDAKEKNNVSIAHAKYGHLRKDYHIAQKLLCLQYSNLNNDILRAYLKNLQQCYVENR
ncbi:DNA mismatch repair protein MSH4 isoform X2 [Physcomitrium patens]|uniref:DNA mismatch repair proteins mutS family domain-containing protein n=1 Tax=Physcomitrium patens TaxID=3218 RepID=A0A7I4D6I1_PHYPA|nr:DNA mismatch repair protein MSH4-like isoform X4 [Physcomitrium patens]|eukprot:XP_024357245.1 DNA mismatch repair protein MSH4-like isoform X4 [Physcomitrella patens]